MKQIDSSPFMPDLGPEVFWTPVWKIHRKQKAGFLLAKRNARIEIQVYFGSWYRSLLERFENNIISLSCRIFSATLCLICHAWTSSNVRIEVDFLKALFIYTGSTWNKSRIEDARFEWRKATIFPLLQKKKRTEKKNEHLEIGKIDRNLKGGSDIIWETF